MIARERLQFAYELAFLLRRLNGKFRGWLKDPSAVPEDELKATEVPPGMVKDVILPKYRVPEW